MTKRGSLKPAHYKSHKPRQFTRPQMQYTYCLFLKHGKHTEIPNRNGQGRDRGPSPRSSKAFPPLPHMRSSSWDPTLLIRDLQGGRVTVRMNPWCCTRTVSPTHKHKNWTHNVCLLFHLSLYLKPIAQIDLCDEKNTNMDIFGWLK